MFRARVQYDWSHTAEIVCKIHNMLRAKNSPARHPRDFHPCPPDREPAEKIRVKPCEIRHLIDQYTK